MVTPIIHADEYGYLMGAHFMARGGAPTGQPYYPGYSALLVPLWWLSDHPLTVYRWALDVNSVLAGVTAGLLYALGRRLAPSARPLVVAAAVVATAAYPALLLYSNLAESENLLVPGFLALCVVVARALERPTPARWAGAGGMAGLLYCVHGRGLAAAAALVLVAVWFLRPWRDHRRALAAGGTALAVGLLVSELAIRWVTRVVPGSQIPSTASTAGHILSRVTTASGLSHIGVVLAGQGLYLLAGAGALVAFGITRMVRSLRLPAGAAPQNAGLAGFVLLSLLAGAVLAAVYLDRGHRLDDAVYGRYVEIFAVPVLLVGVLALAGARTQGPLGRERTVAALGAVIGLLVSGGIVAVYWGTTVHGIVVRTNSFAVADLFWGMPRSRVVMAAVVGSGLVGLVLVTAAFRWAVLAGVVLAVGVFVPSTVRAYADVVNQSVGRQADQVLPHIVAAIQQRFGPLGCLSWDAAGTDAATSWDFYNDRLLLPDTTFSVFDSAERQPVPCSSGVVLAGRSFGSHRPYRTSREVLPGQEAEAVWIMHGPLQDRLARAGWLLPKGFPDTLPADAASGSIRLVRHRPASLFLPAGGSRALTVAVAHTGTGSPWPNAAVVGPVPRYAIRVAAQWFLPSAVIATRKGPAGVGPPLRNGRADLATALLPGEHESVLVRLAAGALAPGRYDVELAVTQEAAPAWGTTIQPIWIQVMIGR